MKQSFSVLMLKPFVPIQFLRNFFLRRLLRNSSQNKFIELLPNTETYKNSYFCRTVKDWNALPSEIVNIKSADRFKKVLFEYFS